MTLPRLHDGLYARADAFGRHLARHRIGYLALLVAALLAEGLRLAIRQKYGDFGPIADALQRLIAGENLYELGSERMAYIYSPSFAVALAPLGLLPSAILRFAWFVLFWLFAAASLRLAGRLVLDASPHAPQSRPAFWVLYIAPVAYFLYYNALNGQTTMLMIFLVLLSYRLDRANRPLLAGLPLAASLLVKPFPLLFIPFYALRGRWNVVASTGAWLLAGLAAPALYFRADYPRVFMEWIGITRLHLHEFPADEWGIQSLWAFWNRVFQRYDAPLSPFPPAHLADGLILASAALLLAVPCLLLLAARWRKLKGEELIRIDHIAFALLMICWAALPSTGWKHYWITLLFPCALLAASATRALPRAFSRRAALSCLAFLLASFVVLHIKVPGHPRFPYWLCWCLLMGMAAYATLSRFAWPLLGPVPANRPRRG